MASHNSFSNVDKKLWKKIRRNGNFRKQNQVLLQSTSKANALSISVTESDKCTKDTAPRDPVADALLEIDWSHQYQENEQVTDSETECDYEPEVDPQDLRNDLRNWAITNQIKHTAINSLLSILKSHISLNNLPKDARTLVQTPRTTDISADIRHGGRYWHYGLAKALSEMLSKFDSTRQELSLNINIDGLPTFKSSSQSFWPILVNIHELKAQHSPVVVGVFGGTYKPKDVNAFLEPFVGELNEIIRNGLIINGTIVNFKVRCFICDTPARSMLRGVIGHNGYSSCLKCVTEGEYCHEYRTMIFPEIDAPLRTDADFRARVYEGHHKTDSILEEIDGLDMINHFPIGDALHLIDLGITKRFLNGWKCGTLNNLNAKWTAMQVQNVSAFLEQCKLPREIKRPARSLEHIARWKGTEFRTFLLYLSPIVLKKFFESTEIFDHFMNFYCAIQICSRHDQPTDNYLIARNLITDFLEGVKVMYGSQLFCSNLHNLVHLVDDVERFGPLDSFDAYPFESRLYTLKKLIRSGNLPLSQVSKRITEMQANSNNSNTRNDKANQFPILKKRCEITGNAYECLMHNDNFTAYSFIDLDDFILDTKSDSDSWVLTDTCEILTVNYIIQDSETEKVYICGSVVQDLMDFFVKPVISSFLFIYASNLKLKSPQLVELHKVRGKMVNIRCNSKHLPKSVLIPLVHTLK